MKICKLLEESEDCLVSGPLQMCGGCEWLGAYVVVCASVGGMRNVE